MLPNDPTPGDEPSDDKEPLPVETEEISETETEEAEDEGEEGEPDAEAEGEKGEDGQPKKLSKTARKNARLRERIATLEEIARHESKRADEAEAARRVLTADLGPPPKRENFADDIEYGAALAGYRAEERVLARTKKTTEATVTETRDAANVSKQNLFRERALALNDRFPDIEARVFGDATLPISPSMAEVIQDSERGPEVAYFLATHREEASRIVKMQPAQAAYALGRIDASLDIAAPKPRTQSNAPPPPKIIKGSGKSLVSKDPDKMTMEEWTTWRNAQLEPPRGRRREA